MLAPSSAKATTVVARLDKQFEDSLELDKNVLPLPNSAAHTTVIVPNFRIYIYIYIPDLFQSLDST